MSILTQILNGTNLNRDAGVSSLSPYLKDGVRSGFGNDLAITLNQCDTGMAFIEVTRTSIIPNEVFILPVWVDTAEVIDTSGDGYIIVEVDQAKINDGSTNNLDGTGIATVKKVTVLPSVNYIELASLASGVITDTRIASGLHKILLDNEEILSAIDSSGDIKEIFKLLTSGDFPEFQIIPRLKSSRTISEDNEMVDMLHVQDSNVNSFGDGSDGDVTISGTTTLSRDMQYNNLIVNGTLKPNGYRIFVKETLSGSGIIENNGTDGNAGGDAVDNTAWNIVGTPGVGGALVSGSSWGTLPGKIGSLAGGDGAYGSSGATGNNATAVANTTNAIRPINAISPSAGSKGGDGGKGQSYNTAGIGASGGGISGITSAILNRLSCFKTWMDLYDWQSGSILLYELCRMTPSSGGGAGGCGDVGNGMGGSGGGGASAGTSGGKIFISAKVITFIGNIIAKGGNGKDGGDGGNASGSGTAYKTGGAGGAGSSGAMGGVIVIFYATKVTLTIDVNGGNRGLGGIRGLNYATVNVEPEDGADGNTGTSGISKELHI